MAAGILALRLAARSRAPIVPLYVRGRNSPLFLLHLHALQTVSDPAAGARDAGIVAAVSIYASVLVLPYAAWADKDLTLEQLAKRFRKHLYRLAKGKSGLFKSESPIALPEERALLKREVEHCEHLGQTPDGKQQIYLYRRQDQPHAPSCANWDGCGK